jgi:hypothetical protein
MKKSKKLQKAAYEAHLRGKKALEEGDIKAAISNDDESADLALNAMLHRLQGK